MAEIPNLEFYFCITSTCSCEIIYEDQTNSLRTGVHKIIQIQYAFYRWNSLLVHFDAFIVVKLTNISHLCKNIANRIAYDAFKTCLESHAKKFRYISDYGSKWLKLQVVLCNFQINLF